LKDFTDFGRQLFDAERLGEKARARIEDAVTSANESAKADIAALILA
jgi:hypothetical protein